MAHRDPMITNEPTIGKLVVDAIDDVRTIGEGIVGIAKLELQASLKSGGVGAALLAVAGFISVLALILGSVTIAYFLAMTGLHLAWCFLIVTGFYLLLALILALVGVRKLKQVKGPEAAMAQAQETKQLFAAEADI